MIRFRSMIRRNGNQCSLTTKVERAYAEITLRKSDEIGIRFRLAG